MKRVLAITTIAFLTTSLLFLSCKKNEDLVNQSNTIIKKTRNGGITPMIENEILKFNSKSDYQSYYDFLLTETNSSIESLIEIEAGLNYKSYRSKIDLIYNNPEGFDPKIDVPNPNFGDRIVQSILNENCEIIIGSTYYNNSYKGKILSLDNYNMSLIKEIRNQIITGTKYLELENKLDALHLEHGDLIIENSNTVGLNKKEVFQTGEDIKIRLFKDFGVDCNSNEVDLTSIGAFVSASNMILACKLVGDFTLNWGDGTAIESWTSGPNFFGCGTNHNTSHTYLVQGNYNIIITFKEANSSKPLVTITSPTNIIYGCGDANNKIKSVWHYPSLGTAQTSQFAIKKVIWSDNNFWSKKFGAYTYVYRSKSNGKYKSYDADNLTINVGGTITDGTCNNPTNKSDNDSDTNDNDVNVNVVVGSDYSYPEINANYSVMIWGSNLTFQENLKTCP